MTTTVQAVYEEGDILRLSPRWDWKRERRSR
jgi:hypothetical protein